MGIVSKWMQLSAVFIMVSSATASFAQDHSAEDQEDPLTLKMRELRRTLEQTVDFLDVRDLTKVKSNIDYISHLMGQIRGIQFSALLPEALEGWLPRDSSSENISRLAFGGALTASKEYRAENADREVTVDYITDSPMIGAFSMMTNPMVMAQSNLPTFRIGTYTFIEENKELKGTVGDVLVSIKGGTQEDRLAFAKALPLEDLQKFK